MKKIANTQLRLGAAIFVQHALVGSAFYWFFWSNDTLDTLISSQIQEIDRHLLLLVVVFFGLPFLVGIPLALGVVGGFGFAIIVPGRFVDALRCGRYDSVLQIVKVASLIALWLYYVSFWSMTLGERVMYPVFFMWWYILVIIYAGAEPQKGPELQAWADTF